MACFNRCDYMESLYELYQGDIHLIMNKYDLDGQDFDYLMDLKLYNNGFKRW